MSPVLLGAGINTRTLEVKRCLTCGSEQPIVEQPKHSCSCGAKANGAGDYAALLEELRLLRGEVKALRQDPLARANARIAAWEQSAAGRKFGLSNGRAQY